jgi:exodeoxyribonuclease-5
MRQSVDSPIPYIAKAASMGQNIFRVSQNISNQVIIKPASKLTKEEIRNADIVLCSTNVRRDELNAYIRKEVYGIDSKLPVVGDKMICRENRWGESIDDTIYLVNGLVGYVEYVDIESIKPDEMVIDFRPEFLKDKMFHNLPIDRKYMNMSYAAKRGYYSHINKFEYAYAITTHLAQGSQYNKVIVDMTGLYSLNSLYNRQWLYTAITRAIQQVILVY